MRTWRSVPDHVNLPHAPLFRCVLPEMQESAALKEFPQLFQVHIARTVNVHLLEKSSVLLERAILIQDVRDSCKFIKRNPAVSVLCGVVQQEMWGWANLARGLCTA